MGFFSGFGFSKSAYAPAPGMPEAKMPEDMPKRPSPSAPKSPQQQYQFRRPQYDEGEQERMEELRERIAEKKEARERFMTKHREQLAREAAYTRDTTQARGRGQAYATEAERLMGGQTGYGSFGSYARFGLAVLDTAVEEVKMASAAVKKITKDVKGGTVPRSDLEAALKDLDVKTQVVADLKKKSGLSGFGKSKIPSWGTLAVVVALAALVIRNWPK